MLFRSHIQVNTAIKDRLRQDDSLYRLSLFTSEIHCTRVELCKQWKLSFWEPNVSVYITYYCTDALINKKYQYIVKVLFPSFSLYELHCDTRIGPRLKSLRAFVNSGPSVLLRSVMLRSCLESITMEPEPWKTTVLSMGKILGENSWELGLFVEGGYAYRALMGVPVT